MKKNNNMNNEIGRKITSLTLMTIMLAGGMVIAAPSMVPEAAAANSTLFVSAENSMFNNTFSGPQVIEIVVSDPAIMTLDDVHGAPDVTVNGNDVVMAQATDGSWYAYVVDVDYAREAQSAQWPVAKGLNFGAQCTSESTVLAYGANYATSNTGAKFAESKSVFFNIATSGTSYSEGNVSIGTKGESSTSCWSFANGTGFTAYSAASATAGSKTTLQNVVRDAKDLNENSALKGHIGQIGLGNQDFWPFIQTYDFNPTGSVVVEYNKAGVNEVTTLTFDSVPTSSSLDRSNVPDNADIFFTVNDNALNIDPTSLDKWIYKSNGSAYYMTTASSLSAVVVGNLMFEDNDLQYKKDASGSGKTQIESRKNADFTGTLLSSDATNYLGVIETGANTGIFTTSDDGDKSTLYVHADALRGNSGWIDYDTRQSIIITNNFAELNLDETSVGDEWNSGEALLVKLIDDDLNLNSQSDEDLDVNNSAVLLVPSLQIGTPATLVSTESSTIGSSVTTNDGSYTGSGVSFTVDSYSKIARGLVANSLTFTVNTGITLEQMKTLNDKQGDIYLNYDIRALSTTAKATGITLVKTGDASAVLGGVTVDSNSSKQDTLWIDGVSTSVINANSSTEYVTVMFTLDGNAKTGATVPFVVDFFAFGDGDSATKRVNDAIYRMELNETGDNTGEFVGSIEYIMVNQINFASGTDMTTVTEEMVPISDEIVIIVHEDLTDEDAPRVNYLDLGADGISTQIADQQDAPTHSGVADLDLDTYKIADTVNISITDMDLNTDNDLIDVYQPHTNDDDQGTNDTKLFSITFDDVEWNLLKDTSQGITLVESTVDSGIFRGSFQIPSTYCTSCTGAGTGTTQTTTGTDIEINYMDHRNASGESIEVGDGAGVRANTGSISLDRTVYPVPWGGVSNFGNDTGAATPNGKSVFPIHASGISGNVTANTETISNGSGDLTVHIRVNDQDLDVSAIGEDKMNTDRTNTSGVSQTVGPIKISISRGTDELTLAYAGGATSSTNKMIVVGKDTTYSARTLGPITEVSGDSGIFELDFDIRYTDGPSSTTCPATNASGFSNLDGIGTAETDRFNAAAASGEEYCILQGDILTVEYLDNVDASGNQNTVTDSATFDLRNGVLQSDKSVYIIGSDMILTIIEPDWDLDNDASEAYDLDVIEWDSDAATGTIGDQITVGTTETSNGKFDPEPSSFLETGDSTGIFQVIIEVPATLSGNNLERGEQIDLQYTDWGPSGSAFVGQEDEDMNVTVYTSNFGATVELDQKVYTWTDKVYITIVAPDHNMDSNLVDTIGNTANDAVKLSTRAYDVDKYSLVETGTDTGIFTGEVILTGFSHDSNGDGTKTGPSNSTSADSTGPTNGYLETSNDDGLTVSFEYSEDDTVVGSALIRWNIGEVEWLEASYPASGTGVGRVIDPDMNLNPEAVDNFKVNVWSDTDSGGINLTVTETNEATGIFEGTVFFTVNDASSGHRLRVSEGDTVTSEYEDNTLPDPYTTADELDVASTTLIGTVVPPLERAPAANLRTVDAFGNSLNAVSIDQQVQLTADLSNGQDKDQAFAYLVQVQDDSGVTVSLAWITGSLSAGQSFSPALSWIPTESGSYTATAFVWESVDNPTALSPSVSTTVNVR